MMLMLVLVLVLVPLVFQNSMDSLQLLSDCR